MVCLSVCLPICRLLRAEQGASAIVRFEKALVLAKLLGNKVQERRAVRGLAASARLQRQVQTDRQTDRRT
jgi:hypothetical protein